MTAILGFSAAVSSTQAAVLWGDMDWQFRHMRVSVAVRRNTVGVAIPVGVSVGVSVAVGMAVAVSVSVAIGVPLAISRWVNGGGWRSVGQELVKGRNVEAFGFHIIDTLDCK